MPSDSGSMPYQRHIMRSQQESRGEDNSGNSELRTGSTITGHVASAGHQQLISRTENTNRSQGLNSMAWRCERLGSVTLFLLVILVFPDLKGLICLS